MSKKGRYAKTRPRSRTQSWLLVASLVPMLAVAMWWFATPGQSNAQSESGQAKPISQLNTADFHSLAFSHTEPSTVFFGHHNGLLISRDGGKTWQPTALQSADAMALAVPSSNPQIMYAAGHGVFVKSTDAGQSWQGVKTNLPSSDIHGFAADPQNAELVYAHAVGFGVFSSQDGGTTWQPLWSEGPASIMNLSVGNNETLYAAAGSEGLWQSRDSGQSWQKAQTPDAGAIAISYEPSRQRLFATLFGDSPGLYASDDAGSSWILILPGVYLAFAASPQNPDELLLVDGRGSVYASHDRGKTW
jgi:photosystem II stability/assembly factor-like uncharacterized protein